MHLFALKSQRRHDTSRSAIRPADTSFSAPGDSGAPLQWMLLVRRVHGRDTLPSRELQADRGAALQPAHYLPAGTAIRRGDCLSSAGSRTRFLQPSTVQGRAQPTAMPAAQLRPMPSSGRSSTALSYDVPATSTAREFTAVTRNSSASCMGSGTATISQPATHSVGIWSVLRCVKIDVSCVPRTANPFSEYQRLVRTFDTFNTSASSTLSVLSFQSSCCACSLVEFVHVNLPTRTQDAHVGTSKFPPPVDAAACWRSALSLHALISSR
jgi:hypothetical protein